MPNAKNSAVLDRGSGEQVREGGLSRHVLLCASARGLWRVRHPWYAWRRPTLPHLRMQYHRRWSVSRPSSGWDRVGALRNNHQANERCRKHTSLHLNAHSGRALTMRAIKPIERLVLVSFTHCCASTPSLSTWSSSTALKGNLVSRGASRLDAFSGYPVRT